MTISELIKKRMDNILVNKKNDIENEVVNDVVTVIADTSHYQHYFTVQHWNILAFRRVVELRFCD